MKTGALIAGILFVVQLALANVALAQGIHYRYCASYGKAHKCNASYDYRSRECVCRHSATDRKTK
jgi:hypothetical protein